MICISGVICILMGTSSKIRCQKGVVMGSWWIAVGAVAVALGSIGGKLLFERVRDILEGRDPYSLGGPEYKIIYPAGWLLVLLITFGGFAIGYGMRLL